jgi:hypothetical protein
MPVFGKSLFETVLDGLGEAAEEEDDTPARIRGMNASFVGRDWGTERESEIDLASLFDGFPPDPVMTGPVVPDWAGRLSETEIAADLAIETCHGAQDLRERRRTFALENHPDRVPDEYRDQATRRMKVANQLIDAALARYR